MKRWVGVISVKHRSCQKKKWCDKKDAVRSVLSSLLDYQSPAENVPIIENEIIVKDTP